ncbi:hypothetical protein ACFWPX_18260 [Nocardia sp. NPDC058518]|uniref:hypothetical protein n=1 Tax=Nocardia sp. NPDC058518 TaxID=3346534 RepID=UPI003665DFB0
MIAIQSSHTVLAVLALVESDDDVVDRALTAPSRSCTAAVASSMPPTTADSRLA